MNFSKKPYQFSSKLMQEAHELAIVTKSVDIDIYYAICMVKEFGFFFPQDAETHKCYQLVKSALAKTDAAFPEIHAIMSRVENAFGY